MHGVGEFFAGLHTRHEPLIRLIDQTVFPQIGDALADGRNRAIEHRAIGVVKPDLEARAREHDRPRAADPPRSNHRNAFIAS